MHIVNCEIETVMDIASRLKKFMDTSGIQYSQFADKCGIPRPSLSQLLNGRNKKVSNEVIEKIHRAYPSLSVAWLMFGEGDMGYDINTQISEPQNSPDNDDSLSLLPENELFGGSESIFANEHPKESDNFVAEKITPTTVPAPRETSNFDGSRAESMSFNMNKSRKVVSIMVFYSDNSFDTFVPKSE